MRGYAAVALIVALDVLLCVFWLGPYWFILVGGVLCGIYIVVSLCKTAGDADDRIAAMFERESK